MHYAKIEDFKRKYHDTTKSTTYTGPGFTLARQLGDAAAGGQVGNGTRE